MRFVHLQIHSSYTMMESTIELEALVKEAKQAGMTSLALTDHEVLFGAYRFYQLCQEYGIKPVIGMTADVYVASENRPLRFILLAKNKAGYEELVSLSNQVMGKNQPIRLEDLARCSNVFFILSVYNTFLEELAFLQEYDTIQKLIQTADQQLNHMYMNVQPFVQHERLNQWIYDVSSQLGDRMVATVDVRYLKEQDQVGYEALLAMKRQASLSSIKQKKSGAHHFIQADQLPEPFVEQFPEAIHRTTELADACSVEFPKQWFHLPTFSDESDRPSMEILRELCEKQLNRKCKADQLDEAKKRLEVELSVIERMDFADYFLIVWDFMRYAHKQNILTGPGRGSAAGSLVAFLLGITKVNPLDYDLLFERFLNPERKSMPDIDIDFSDYRRDEMIQYVKNKYGQHRVAQIITFGTFQSRSIIRELSKIFQLDDQQLNWLLKHLPQQPSSLKKHIREDETYRNYIQESPKLVQMFQAALVIEGLPRHHSTHAAGVVISDRSLTKDVPIVEGQDDVYLTQFPMQDLEAIGLLKMDFLGLRNLSLLERMIKQIHEKEGKIISLDRLTMDDAKTFQLLRSGHTTGVFQLESSGMKSALRQIKPNRLEDIVAVNALYRPGPMQFIETYAKRKHGKEAVQYIHDDLKPILEETNGVLIYQEQIMQVVSKIAGFSYGQADILRRAISKKDPQAISEMKESFLKGAEERGYSADIAEEIFSWIERFADYGFNKSHSVAYSMISYQTAYFKANYPAYFYAELLSSVIHDSTKLERYIKEARQVGLEVLPPSINRSFGKFTVEEPKKVRFGLLGIKGFGRQALVELLEARKQKPFRDLFDFTKRVHLNVISRTMIESLIIAGAFDESNRNRAQLLASTVQAIEQGELFSQFNEQINWNDELFQMDVEYTPAEPFSTLKEISMEKEVLGFTLSDHPLKSVRRSLMKQGVQSIQQTLQLPVKKHVKVAASIDEIKQIRTKRGEQMAFVQFQDETGTTDGVLFPSVYREVSRNIEEGMMAKIEGRTDERNGEKQLIVQNVNRLDLDQLPVDSPQIIFIRVYENENEALMNLKQLGKRYPGTTPIVIHLANDKKTYQLSVHYDLKLSEEVIRYLEELFGSANVAVQRRKHQ